MNIWRTIAVGLGGLALAGGGCSSPTECSPSPRSSPTRITSSRSKRPGALRQLGLAWSSALATFGSTQSTSGRTLTQRSRRDHNEHCGLWRWGIGQFACSTAARVRGGRLDSGAAVGWAEHARGRTGGTGPRLEANEVQAILIHCVTGVA